MSEDRIEFVSNYNDLSTDKGFQFEFFCNRCSSGYRTRFQPSVTGTVSGALDAASSLFGGFLSQAADLGNRVHTAGWERAHDAAFEKAVQEMRPDFIQCPRCHSWVCRKSCWNTKKGLCKECAPDLGVEMSAAQSSRTVEEIWAHSQMAEEDRQMLTEKSWREGVRATCPQCEAPLANNAKFCPECGAKIKQEIFCTECGAKMAAAAKFCPECGKKREE
ncbi:MAG TPA: zinc ribbon domain-containing protein [Anaerolineaceae bacterium]|jgi:membrane protease subunit (stomatin/prohibitin family)|nr:zinc ribbon domain-containing protein [Anaerolineaceae bacterium]